MSKSISHLSRLLEGEALSGDEVMTHLRDHSLPEDVDYAKTLTKADVKYLRSWQIDQIIEATLSEPSAIQSATFNFQTASRIGVLLPSILSTLERQDLSAISYVVNRVFDMAQDFSIEPSDSRRVDRVRNDKLRVLNRSATALAKAVTTLTTLDSEVWEFGSELKTIALMGGSHPEGPSDEAHVDVVESLVNALSAAIVATKVISYDLASATPRNPAKSTAMSKGDVVSLCYDLYFQCGGPPIRTTPGSSFSFLASLLYEAVTGRAQESLAGAVIDFARSQTRRSEDDYQREQDRDEEAYRNGNNFHHQRVGRLNDLNAADWYRSAAKEFGTDVLTGEMLLRVAQAFDSSAADRELEFGPFIVWAENMPDWRDGSIARESIERAEKLRALRRRLGDLRRQARSLGLADFD